MGQQIIKQPDGKLAVFSSIVDAFIVVDATPEEIVEWRAEEAAEKARERTRTELGHVLADNPQAAYYQFALTWEEAAESDRENSDDLEEADIDTRTEVRSTTMPEQPPALWRRTLMAILGIPRPSRRRPATPDRSTEK